MRLYAAVPHGQGMQVMRCMTNKLLRDDLYFVTISRTQLFWRVIRGEDFFLFFQRTTCVQDKKCKIKRMISNDDLFFREHCNFRTKIVKSGTDFM